MSIFGETQVEKKNTINVVRKKDGFYAIYNGWPYNLSPSQVTKFNMPPNIVGMDEVLRRGSDMKGLRGNLVLELNYELVPKADARAVFSKDLFDGWVYEAFGECLKFQTGLVWVCPYLRMMLGTPPELIFLTINPSFEV